MPGVAGLEEKVQEFLDLDAEARRKYVDLLKRVLGDTLEERIEPLRTINGLTPAEVREAVKAYREGKS